MSEVRAHRIFFALWPDDALRQQLKQTLTPLLANHKARRVPVHNWHITLAFLGNVTQQNYECAQLRANEVVGSTFDLTLDQFGYWPRPRVVWLGSSTLPDPLHALVSNLNSALQLCDYTPEHRIYSPHLTLLRKANHGLEVDTVEPIHWHIDHFVLVESVQTKSGSLYQVVKRWPLST
jgi:2'-5' RNA ligase